MIVLLSMDVDLAIAYVTIAHIDQEREKDTDRANAREVYETALHLLTQAALPQDEDAEIRDKLAALKSGLQSLGEIF